MKINRNFCVREIAGDFILVPVGEAALEFSGIITTNEVGALIWETLQQDVTMEQLVQKITDEFEIDSKTAQSDAEEFVQRLKSLGLLDEKSN